MKKSLKKLIVAISVFGIVVGSVYCFNNSSKASQTKNKDMLTEKNSKSYEKKIKKTINKLIKCFHNEDYEKVRGMFTENEKDILTIDALKQIRMLCFYKDYFVEIDDIFITEVEENYKVVITIREKHRYHTVIVFLDKNINIMEMYKGMTKPIPEQSEYFMEEELQIGALEKYPLNGVLTTPVNTENPPVVILVHGSGYHDADESIGSNRMFAEIAHGLAKQGIATIRYNERFYQYPYLLSLDEDGDGIPDMKN